jgi:pSer/pThr/pTyr-binding forkhead associated (FHA) protein
MDAVANQPWRMKNQASSAYGMVQLNVLSEENLPQLFQSKSFPVRIGRGEDCHLQLTDTGIWANHLELNLNKDHQFTIRTTSEATAMVNGQPLEGLQLLHNGDLIEIGMVKIQFWLGTVQQKTLGIREFAVWALLLIVTVVEIYLLRWLG